VTDNFLPSSAAERRRKHIDLLVLRLILFYIYALWYIYVSLDIRSMIFHPWWGNVRDNAIEAEVQYESSRDSTTEKRMLLGQSGSLAANVVTVNNALQPPDEVHLRLFNKTRLYTAFGCFSWDTVTDAIWSGFSPDCLLSMGSFAWLHQLYPANYQHVCISIKHCFSTKVHVLFLIVLQVGI